MYCREKETIDHLLIYCNLAKELRSRLMAVLDIHFVMLLAFFCKLLECWEGGCRMKRKKKTWMVAPLCIMWFLWRVRNTLNFEAMELWVQKLKHCYCIIFGVRFFTNPLLLL